VEIQSFAKRLKLAEPNEFWLRRNQEPVQQMFVAKVVPVAPGKTISQKI
jgi:hypothetical protein